MPTDVCIIDMNWLQIFQEKGDKGYLPFNWYAVIFIVRNHFVAETNLFHTYYNQKELDWLFKPINIWDNLISFYLYMLKLRCYSSFKRKIPQNNGYFF